MRLEVGRSRGDDDGFVEHHPTPSVIQQTVWREFRLHGPLLRRSPAMASGRSTPKAGKLPPGIAPSWRHLTAGAGPSNSALRIFQPHVEKSSSTPGLPGPAVSRASHSRRTEKNSTENAEACVPARLPRRAGPILGGEYFARARAHSFYENRTRVHERPQGFAH